MYFNFNGPGQESLKPKKGSKHWGGRRSPSRGRGAMNLRRQKR